MILGIFLLLLIIVCLFVIAFGLIQEQSDVLLSGLFFLVIVLIMPMVSVKNHANDLATIKEQDRIIKIQEEQVLFLSKQLEKIVPNGRQKNLLLANEDSPIKSLVASITEATNKLTEARVAKGEAYKSIHSRKLGFFSFVPWLIDDEGETK